MITGMGAVTPIGIGFENYWKSLVEGKSGISKITLFDPSDLETQIAGEVKGFDPLNFMDKQDARRNDRFTQFALAASEEAIRDSGIDLGSIDRFRAGVIIGSGIGAWRLSSSSTR